MPTKQGKILIVARAPEAAQAAGGLISNRLAGYTDMSIFVLTDEGERIELPDVSRVLFKGQCGPEPLSATVEIFPKAFECEAWAKIEEPKMVGRLRNWFEAVEMDPPYAEGSPGALLFESCRDYFRGQR